MRPNFIDRAIGYIAPGVAARRLRSRMALEFLTRGYDGAQKGRMTASWRAHGSSADSEIAVAAPLLRDRMRDLVRNNPHAANAVAQLEAHIIGDGIVPRAKTNDDALNVKVNKLFDEFAKVCDRKGMLDFYAIQALAVRGMIESGDGLIKRHRASPTKGFPVALQLEVFETDLIDSSKVWAKRKDGSYAIQGIQFDAEDRRSYYWLFGSHPDNGWIDPKGTSASVPFPASDIAHAYEHQRVATRGVPWGSPTIINLRNLDGYEEAELVRKRIESCMVGIVVPGDETDGIGIPLDDEDQGPGVYDMDGFPVERFEPGMFAYAKGGRDIRFNQPAATGSYETYKKSQLHTIAAGFRIPYALLSGDLSQVNYSSTKVGLEAFKRLVSKTQWQIVIPMICQPIWEWFCEAAYIAGKIPTKNIPVEWTPPRFVSADPKKDAEVAVLEMRSGLMSPQRAVAETGYDPDEVLAEYAEWFGKLDKLGIVLDSDPRRVTQAGQTQAQAEPDDTDEGKPDDG